MNKFITFLSVFVLFSFCLVCSVSAADITSLPSLPSVSDAKYDYFVYKKRNEEQIRLDIIGFNNVNSAARASAVSSTTIKYEFKVEPTEFTIYHYYLDGSLWVLEYTSDGQVGNYHTFDTDAVRETIYYSNKNIYTNESTGDIFFTPTPIPTPMTVPEMLEVEIPALGQKVTQAMMIILLCGVGCLVLLIILPVFSKVFRTFQVK